MTNANYDKLFEEQKKVSDGKKLLLHVCCAPCATYCLTRVLDCFDVTLYYSNDNVTNFDEWQKRLAEVQKLVTIVNDGDFETKSKYTLKLVVQPFDNRRFFNVAKGYENQPEGGLRCEQCFRMRLGDSVSFAQTHNFDLIGTTLTVSPYKNSKLLNELGAELCKNTNVDWLSSDFKKHGGYNESVRLSQKYQLYRQHYCGCVFSDWSLTKTQDE